jgi:hypothetical protein
MFDRFFVDLEIGSLRIEFDRASSVLDGESVVCFSGLMPESRRRKRAQTGEIRMCGNTFNISIFSKYRIISVALSMCNVHKHMLPL